MSRILRVLVPVLVVALVLGGFGLTVAFLVWQSREVPTPAEILVAEQGSVELKTVATGSVVPRNEVAVKSRVSGVVAELFVEPGQAVAAGDRMATIRILPNSASLQDAQSDVQRARISWDDAKLALERTRGLQAKAAISDAELQSAQTAEQLAAQAYRAAVSNLEIVREGATRGGGDVSTEVVAPVPGMVLSVDVKVGYSVIESNTFNEGTTVAYVADMDDLVFEGFLDESEVGRVKEGMAITLTVGALQDQKLVGTLEYISPKGIEQDGAVQFEIRAAVTPPDGVFVRAGSSANADIVLGRADDVVVLDERALRFGKDRVWVQREGGGEVDVEVGLSDGMRIEITKGLTAGERVEAPTTVAPSAGGGRRGPR
jgi:HlyD family secretion protein